MSGSGGGGNWPPENEVPCNRLRFDTQIATPQPDALPALNVGDVLDVGIISIGGAQAVAVSKNRETVGGLAGGMVARLRECILSGHTFKATVLSINGAQVMVRIEPA